MYKCVACGFVISFPLNLLNAVDVVCLCFPRRSHLAISVWDRA